MAAQLLEGAPVAEKVLAEVAEDVKRLADRGVTPGLGTVLVGDDPASARYVAKKHEACARVGIASIHEQLVANASQQDVLATIARFNADPAVHGYLVQLPLPKGLDEDAALLAIDPEKDADGLHPVNLGRLVIGADGPLPCTPAGIQALLVHHHVPIEGQHVVIVGRGITLGRPLSLLLTLKRPNANAAVTVVHTGVDDLGVYTRQADILVAAAGRAGLIQPDMVKRGAAVVGGGQSFDGNRVLSDVDESVGEVAGWITPRIGGVGPTTVAMLLRNTVLAAERRASSR
jgi:methylenetetrahydrofolate dehydrogenase (NADP+)/methenyltetrahydrofolate cyclohydrolase